MPRAGGYVDLAGFDIAGAAGDDRQDRQGARHRARRRACRSSICRMAGTPDYVEAGGPGSPNWHKSNALKTMRARPELQGNCSRAAAGITSWSRRSSRSRATSSLAQDALFRLLQFAARQRAARARHPQHRLRRHRHQRLRREHAARRLPPRIFRGDAGGCDPPSRARLRCRRRPSTTSRNSSAGSRTVADFCGTFGQIPKE